MHAWQTSRARAPPPVPPAPGSYLFGLWAKGGWVGSTFPTPPDGGTWGTGTPQVQLYHVSGSTTNDWVCSGKWLAATPWASASKVTASDIALDGFAEGDLYYGVVAQVRGCRWCPRRLPSPPHRLRVPSPPMRAGVWGRCDDDGPCVLWSPQLHDHGERRRGGGTVELCVCVCALSCLAVSKFTATPPALDCLPPDRPANQRG